MAKVAEGTKINIECLCGADMFRSLQGGVKKRAREDRIQCVSCNQTYDLVINKVAADASQS